MTKNCFGRIARCRWLSIGKGALLVSINLSGNRSVSVRCRRQKGAALGQKTAVAYPSCQFNSVRAAPSTCKRQSAGATDTARLGFVLWKRAGCCSLSQQWAGADESHRKPHHILFPPQCGCRHLVQSGGNPYKVNMTSSRTV